MSALNLARVALVCFMVAAAPAVAQEPAKNWKGPYVGLHLGVGEHDVSGQYDMEDFEAGETFVDNGEGPFSLSSNDYLGGLQVGYNYQWSHLVLGVEGDFSYMNARSFVRYGSDDDELTAKMNWLSTVRARVGFAYQNVLFYGTAGIAMIDASFSANDDYVANDPGDSGSVDLNKTGLALGGGIEYALNSSWSIRGEGIHMDFSDDVSLENINDDDTSSEDFVTLDDMFVARVALNYAF